MRTLRAPIQCTSRLMSFAPTFPVGPVEAQCEGARRLSKPISAYASHASSSRTNWKNRHRLDTVANPRVHATTRRVVNEAFAEERASLRPLPLAPFRSVLKLERRISREGMVSIGGNFYSVPTPPRV
jgi:hypothetical protein